jgi:hypothetical protein
LEPNTKSEAGTKLGIEICSQIFDRVAQFAIGLLQKKSSEKVPKT